MRRIENQPILAYLIILVIIALVFIDKELLSLMPGRIIVVGIVLIAALISLGIRKRTSQYI
jgi:hypothetical protein